MCVYVGSVDSQNNSVIEDLRHPGRSARFVPFCIEAGLLMTSSVVSSQQQLYQGTSLCKVKTRHE